MTEWERAMALQEEMFAERDKILTDYHAARESGDAEAERKARVALKMFDRKNGLE